MNIAEKNRIFLEKLRNLPEKKKKIILWTIVVILAAGMGYFWINSAFKNFSKMAESAKNINLPTIDVDMPSLDILETTTPTNK